jgi:hypothetical protein
MEGTSCDRLISDSSSKIPAWRPCRRFCITAIDTYMYYYSHFGRDSIDDNGMVSKETETLTPSSYQNPDPTVSRCRFVDLAKPSPLSFELQQRFLERISNDLWRR